MSLLRITGLATLVASRRQACCTFGQLLQQEEQYKPKVGLSRVRVLETSRSESEAWM